MQYVFIQLNKICNMCIYILKTRKSGSSFTNKVYLRERVLRRRPPRSGVVKPNNASAASLMQFSSAFSSVFSSALSTCMSPTPHIACVRQREHAEVEWVLRAPDRKKFTQISPVKRVGCLCGRKLASKASRIQVRCHAFSLREGHAWT